MTRIRSGLAFKTVLQLCSGSARSVSQLIQASGVVLATTGRFITGLISAGLPEVVTTQLVIRCRIPPRVAVATSVFVLAIAAGAGAAVHALSATPVWYVVAWSVPGVLVGGTIGTRVGKFVPEDAMEEGLGVVFGLVGVLVLGVEFVCLRSLNETSRAPNATGDYSRSWGTGSPSRTPMGGGPGDSPPPA